MDLQQYKNTGFICNIAAIKINASYTDCPTKTSAPEFKQIGSLHPIFTAWIIMF